MRIRLPFAPFAAGILTCLGVSILRPAAFSATSPLSVEELFRSDGFESARLSPDGRHLAAIVRDNSDHSGLFTVDLQTFKQNGLRGGGHYDVYSFRWLGNDRLVFNVSRDRIYAWGLFSAPISDLSDLAELNRHDVTRIVSVPSVHPDRPLIWVLKSSDDRFHRDGGLVEIDASPKTRQLSHQENSDQYRRVFTPPPAGVVIGWETNDRGELAGCWTWLDGHQHLYRYLPDTDAWKPAAFDDTVVTPVRLDSDERFMWVVTYAPAPGYELRRLDLETGALDAPVYADHDYDLAGSHLYFSAKTGALVGLSYVKPQRVSVWFSKKYASIQAAADHLHPDTINTLVQRDTPERKFLFRLSGPTRADAFAVLDLDTKAMHLVAESAPELKDRPLRPTRVVAFTTRDGVKLEAFVTAPADASPKHPVPMVVLPHGGPWVRDEIGFDPEVQFLASRGYLVLQPNYRGSSGYRPEISDEHRFDYVTMRNDVTDATRALLAGGLADPKHVAIMGGSFGGYLALCGVTFEDNLYCCAVTTCGVFDWEAHIRSKLQDSRPGEYEFLLDNIGRPGRDHDALAEFSPLAHVDRVHVPVFIAHGKEDTVADVAQSKRLAAALKKQGVPCETFFRDLEGHGFYNYKNRVDYYHRVEAFLAANLGGATLTPVK